jgi:hypothetical protein
MTEAHGRILDYVPRLVDANLRYLSRDHLPDVANVWEKSIWWQGGPVLDQGREGACVGFGCAGEYFASPVRGRLPQGALRVPEGNRIGRKVYGRAKEIDEWEGVDYDGTSVRAGLLVGREWGWWKSFVWAKDMNDMRQQLEHGPVVIGFRVMTGVFDPTPGGIIDFSGIEEGWHCVVVTGYSPRYSTYGRRVRIRQSWGKDHGKTGNVYADPDELNENLFVAGGEAGLVLDRALTPVV